MKYDGRAIVLEPEDRVVYSEICGAVKATNVDVLEKDDDRMRLIVGGPLSQLTNRLTTQALASRAGERDDLLEADRQAKVLVRQAQRGLQI